MLFTHRSLTSALAFAAVLLAPVAALGAETLRVPQDFGTIQAAVDAAVEGDEILVTKGSYSENVVLLDRTGLTLRGKGKPVVDGGGIDTGLVIDGGADLTVMGFTFTNGDFRDGMEVLGADGITLQKLTFEGGQVGVSFEDCTNVLVEKCRFEQLSSSGVEFERCTQLTVRKCRFQFVDSDCICGEVGRDITIERNVFRDIDEAIDLTTSFDGNMEDVLVDHNKVSKLEDDGISLRGRNIVVTYNKVVAAPDDGIELDYDVPVPDGNTASGFVVEHNVVTRPESDGITVCGPGALIEKNKIVQPGKAGLRMEGPDAIVRDLRVIKPGYAGLELEEFAGSTVENVTIVRPATEGICTDDIATGATLARVTVRKPGELGFLIESEKATFVDCKVIGSKLDGFYVDGDDNNFIGCSAQKNARYGFNVDAVSNAFDGIKALKNGVADVLDLAGEGENDYTDSTIGIFVTEEP